MPINPSNKLGDPNYRWYNCNLQAPKIKCNQLDAAVVNAVQVGNNGPKVYAGYKPMASVHNWTSYDIPSLAMSDMAGELTIYYLNTGGTLSNVTMSHITRNGGLFQQTNIYQRTGNFTSIDMTSTSDSVQVTISPAAECKWFYRGY